jgi:hypothetical protein
MYPPEGSRSTASPSASSIEIKPPRSKLPPATPYPSSSGVGVCWAPLGVAPCMFSPNPPWLLLVRSCRGRLIVFSARFEFRTATTLMCAAIVSFRSLVPRFVPAISGQQLTETYGGATRRFNCRKMFGAVFVSFDLSRRDRRFRLSLRSPPRLSVVYCEGGKPAIVRGKEPPTWSRIFTEWERKVEATFDGVAGDLRSAASVFMTGTLARPGC